ncbi:hypothetical protein RJZ90_003207 [Blastomyces dermatitidis]
MVAMSEPAKEPSRSAAPPSARPSNFAMRYKFIDASTSSPKSLASVKCHVMLECARQKKWQEQQQPDTDGEGDADIDTSGEDKPQRGERHVRRARARRQAPSEQKGKGSVGHARGLSDGGENHVSDAAISATLSCAAVEDFDSRPERKPISWIHMRAAMQKIRARGGPAAFQQNQRMAMLINWQDYILAGYETKEPSFFYEDTPANMRSSSSQMVSERKPIISFLNDLQRKLLTSEVDVSTSVEALLQTLLECDDAFGLVMVMSP